MSANTKQILAITLGSLGLVLGIFSTVVAYNAKQASDKDENLTAEVQAQFAAAQSAQDAKEADQASKAEKLIAGLTEGEKKLVTKLRSNSKGVKQNKKQLKSQKNQLNTLTNRDRSLENEIASVENKQQQDFNSLTKRLNNQNQEIQDLQQSLKRLRNRVSIDEEFSN